MKKLCLHCGNPNNVFHGEWFYVGEDLPLCSDCAKYIRGDMNDIYYVKTEEEFIKLKNKIIATCKQHFNETVTGHIIQEIDKRHNSLQFIHESTLPPDSGRIPNSNTSIMYGNIGGKIKGLVKIITFITAIAYIIAGIILLCEDLPGAGVIVMIVGPLLAWISSFIIYGFGQLIENSDTIVDLLANN